MNRSVFFLIFCLFVTILQNVEGGSLVKSGPVTIANCECSGVEIKDGSTQREFRLMCKKTTGTGKKKTTSWHTSCIYGGDPHPCKNYNKNGGQQKFYDGLLNTMAKSYCKATNLANNACQEDVVFHSDAICTEIGYTYNRNK